MQRPSTLDEQDSLTSPASPITNVVAADAEVERAPSSPVIPRDEEERTMRNLVEVNTEERVVVKLLLRNSQESCRVKRWKVPKSVVEAVDLTVKLVDNAVVAPPGAVGVADPCIDDLSGQLASTSAEVVPLTIQLYDLEEERKKATMEQEELLQKLRTEVELFENYIGAERDSALSHYHGVLRSFREIVNVADERDAGHADRLTQLRLLFEESRKVKAVSSSAGPSQGTSGCQAGEYARGEGTRVANATWSCF